MILCRTPNSLISYINQGGKKRDLFLAVFLLQAERHVILKQYKHPLTFLFFCMNL